MVKPPAPLIRMRLICGHFAHAKPADCFLHLRGRYANGAYAQRFKNPLGAITKSQIDYAVSSGKTLLGELTVPVQRGTTTGANIGGS